MFGNLFGSATPFDAALAELGELVYSPEFKAAQLQSARTPRWSSVDLFEWQRV